MLKTCKICGKEFIPRQANYKCCSPECSKINAENLIKIHNKKWYHSNRPKYKAWNRTHAPAIYCKICGEEVPKVYTDEKVYYQRYHEECIVSSALTAIRNGERLARSQALRRAANHGYTVKELKQMLKEEIA